MSDSAWSGALRSEIPHSERKGTGVIKMDSFVDKMAQKFTAQDMINANIAAEEKELQRLRMQVNEYDARLQEMRKLNLKNLELADNLQAMIDAENARLQENAGAEDQQDFEKADEISAALAENKAKIEEMTEKLMMQTKQLTVAKLETMEKLDAVASRIESRLPQENRPMLDEIAARLDNRAALEEIASKIDSRPTLTEITEALAAQADAEEPDAGKELGEKLDEVNAQLTDHVHKENVKVYRNVQAALIDENKKLAEALAMPQADIKAQLDKVDKKVTGLKALAVITLIASLANIALWVLDMAGMLPVF